MKISHSKALEIVGSQDARARTLLSRIDQDLCTWNT